MVSASSPAAPASVLSPTGPPPNFPQIARRISRSSLSSPAASTSSRSRASAATAASMCPAPLTSAKSRTRLSSRLATRGVPRERAAIASAPARSISTSRMPADRYRQLAVLHRRVEGLLQRARQAVDLVDEEHAARLERRQVARHVALALEGRAGAGLEVDLQLVRDDL